MRKTKNKAKTKSLTKNRNSRGPRLPTCVQLDDLQPKMLVLYAFNAVKLIPRWQKDSIATKYAAIIQAWLAGTGSTSEASLARSALVEEYYDFTDTNIAFALVCDAIFDEKGPAWCDRSVCAADAVRYALVLVSRNSKSRVRTKIVKNYKELRDIDKITERYLLGKS